MESRPTPESPSQRPHVAWRRGAAISAGLLAGALFVGAHAGDLGLPIIDVTPLSRAEKPTEVKTPQWVNRGRGTKSGSAASDPQYVSPASVGQGSANGGMVRIDWPDDAGMKSDAIGQSLNMLELPSLDMAMGAAGPQFAPQFISRPFHAMGGGGFSGASGAGAMGASASQRAQASQEDSVACCTDPAAEDNRLQPLLDAAAIDGPIPEPATWVTVILGLGLTGVALRGLRRRAAA
jgi:hypothetical protein